jgi:hypothetical protein
LFPPVSPPVLPPPVPPPPEPPAEGPVVELPEHATSVARARTARKCRVMRSPTLNAMCVRCDRAQMTHHLAKGRATLTSEGRSGNRPATFGGGYNGWETKCVRQIGLWRRCARAPWPSTWLRPDDPAHIRIAVIARVERIRVHFGRPHPTVVAEQRLDVEPLGEGRIRARHEYPSGPSQRPADRWPDDASEYVRAALPR